ncbi:MAG: hypothetical protein Q8O83_02405 [bacterium]|nr:hypothetical protein [bacterium]
MAIFFTPHQKALSAQERFTFFEYVSNPNMVKMAVSRKEDAREG